MTFQCASVRSMPICGGEDLGEVLVPLVVLGQEAFVVDVDRRGRRASVTGMAASSGSARSSGLGALAGHRHQRRHRHRAAGQQQVPVGPAEPELAPVVDAALLEQA